MLLQIFIGLVVQSSFVLATTNTSASDGSRCRLSDPCFPSQQEMSELADALDGTLYLPHMDSYKTYVLAYNTFEQRYPGLVAMVRNVNDIREAILWARKFNLHVTIRSSGHCYLGRSTWDGSFNINLAWMKDMEVTLVSGRSTYGEIKVQTGLQWIEIYRKVHEYKRVVVGGSAQTVSPGGYTLGGGHSPISRSFGYAVDNVLEFQIVLADGTIATCTESQCSMIRPDGSGYTDTSGDLFWAIRGGGGGTYGVIVYFVFKLHMDASQMVLASVVVPFKIDIKSISTEIDITTRTLDALAALVYKLPKEWGGYWLLDNAKYDFVDPVSQLTIDIHGKITIFMNKFGPWDGTEEDVFADFLQLSNEYTLNFTFSNKTGFLDYERDVHDPPTSRTTFFAALLQNSSFNDALKDFIRKEMYQTYRPPEVMACTFIMLGGKTTEFAVESTPLHKGYRSARASVTCGVLLGAVDENNYFQAPQTDTYFKEKADRSAAEMRLLGDGMYFNEASKTNPHWKSDFWNNYSRLLQIKQKFDPTNFFTCHQCVGSDLITNVSDNDDTSGGVKCSSGAVWVFVIFTLAIFKF